MNTSEKLELVEALPNVTLAMKPFPSYEKVHITVAGGVGLVHEKLTYVHFFSPSTILSNQPYM